MKKGIIILTLLALAVTLSAQVAKTPSSVNMSQANGSVFNTAVLDMVEGKLYLSAHGQRSYPYVITDIQPNLNVIVRQRYCITTKDMWGNVTNFSITIYGKVIEKLSELDATATPLFTISK